VLRILDRSIRSPNSPPRDEWQVTISRDSARNLKSQLLQLIPARTDTKWCHGVVTAASEQSSILGGRSASASLGGLPTTLDRPSHMSSAEWPEITRAGKCFGASQLRNYYNYFFKPRKTSTSGVMMAFEVAAQQIVQSSASHRGCLESPPVVRRNLPSIWQLSKCNWGAGLVLGPIYSQSQWATCF
jgi:hypothetical protein